MRSRAFVVSAFMGALLAGVGAATAQERQEAFPLLAGIPERPLSTDARENARRYREWVAELQAGRCAMLQRMEVIWSPPPSHSPAGVQEHCPHMRQSRSPASSPARAQRGERGDASPRKNAGSGGQRPPNMDAQTGRGE